MSNAAPQSLHDLGFSEIERLLEGAGINPVHAKALWRALHREGAVDLTTRSFLPPLKRWVEANVGDGKPFFLDAPEVVDEIRSSDGLTRKFLLRLGDGQVIETVLMAILDGPMPMPRTSDMMSSARITASML
jgi:23S rRNA (adenine2503-C2)-methyltransferase